jgi:hypothetical protein
MAEAQGDFLFCVGFIFTAGLAAHIFERVGGWLWLHQDHPARTAIMLESGLALGASFFDQQSAQFFDR